MNGSTDLLTKISTVNLHVLCLPHYPWYFFTVTKPIALYKFCTFRNYVPFQINQPTRCNSFTSLLLDVYVWLLTSSNKLVRLLHPVGCFIWIAWWCTDLRKSKLCSMYVALSKTIHSEKCLTLKLKNFMRPGIHLISCPIILKDETMSGTL